MHSMPPLHLFTEVPACVLEHVPPEPRAILYEIAGREPGSPIHVLRNLDLVEIGAGSARTMIDNQQKPEVQCRLHIPPSRHKIAWDSFVLKVPQTCFLDPPGIGGALFHKKR